jgi:hypothetical protein
MSQTLKSKVNAIVESVKTFQRSRLESSPTTMLMNGPPELNEVISAGRPAGEIGRIGTAKKTREFSGERRIPGGSRFVA